MSEEKVTMPFNDEDPEYLEGVLKNYIKAKFDLEEDVAFVEPSEYLPNYSQPQNEEEFVECIRKVQDIGEALES